MKGLQQALRDREERHSRVEKHEISPQQQEKNTRFFLLLRKRCHVEVSYYCAFHDIVRQGVVSEISLPLGYLVLGREKILLEDIYDIREI